MSFYKLSTGEEATGDPTKAFLSNFDIIPNNTQALAKIISFEITEKDSKYLGFEKYILVTWQIISDDFKGRQITQKLRVFAGNSDQIDRSLHMLMLIMKLCNYTPTHAGEPTNQELMAMNGKILGIKIREWSMPKKDSSDMLEGNFVSEVHPAANYELKVGVKKEQVMPIPTSLETAFSRNRPKTDLDLYDDVIPF